MEGPTPPRYKLPAGKNTTYEYWYKHYAPQPAPEPEPEPEPVPDYCRTKTAVPWSQINLTADCHVFVSVPNGVGFETRELEQVAENPRPSSPFRVSVCAARTLNATGQSRVTLSLRQEHF